MRESLLGLHGTFAWIGLALYDRSLMAVAPFRGGATTVREWWQRGVNRTFA
jgi:putative methionine-R-sulfoxide reductase with GAF domain